MLLDVKLLRDGIEYLNRFTAPYLGLDDFWLMQYPDGRLHLLACDNIKLAGCDLTPSVPSDLMLPRRVMWASGAWGIRLDRKTLKSVPLKGDWVDLGFSEDHAVLTVKKTGEMYGVAIIDHEKDYELDTQLVKPSTGIEITIRETPFWRGMCDMAMLDGGFMLGLATPNSLSFDTKHVGFILNHDHFAYDTAPEFTVKFRLYALALKAICGLDHMRLIIPQESEVESHYWFEGYKIFGRLNAAKV